MAERELVALARTSAVRSIVAAVSSTTQIYLVGGVVRDLIGNQQCGDLDIAISGPIERRCDEFKTAGIRVIETGLKHGTITLLIDDQPIEVTSFRRAGRAGGNEGSSIKEDIAARDFTINALAFDIRSEKLIDLHQSQEDIKVGLLRAVGSAQDRLVEDPLRILRAIRFGPASGRRLDLELQNAIRTNCLELKNVAVERIRSEFEKILVSTHVRPALQAMYDFGIFAAIIPEVLVTVGFEQNDFHTEDVFGHTLSVVERTRNDKVLRLAAFFHDIGKAHTLTVSADGARHFYQHEIVSAEICERVMERLKFSSRETRDTHLLVRHHMRPFEVGPAGLRRLMRDLGDLFSLWREFKMADSPPVMSNAEFQQRLDSFDKMVAEELERQKGDPFGKLAVDGEDLKNLGFLEGRQLGDALKALREVVLDDPTLNTREELLRRAEKFPKG